MNYDEQDTRRSPTRAALKESPVSLAENPRSGDRFAPEVRKTYKFYNLLGQGVEGKVFKAKHRASNTAVAIKIIDKFLYSEEGKKHVLREVGILKKLSELPGASSFIAPLKDIIFSTSLDRDKLYIVLEYVEGITLKEFLDQAQAKTLEISTREISILTRNLLRAVEFIHEAGVLHRDIKPDNIMVTPDLQVKLIDFGFATEIGTSKNDSKTPESRAKKREVAKKLIQDREVRKAKQRSLSPHVQTRIYRSPEVTLQEADYGFPIDIWSVGCILAELFQCDAAYTHETADPFARYLFMSTHCSSLSPATGQELNGELDHLRVVFSVLGDQRSIDLSFLPSAAKVHYCKSFMNGSSRIRWAKEFDCTPLDLLRVLKKCLEFNPFFRPSAAELLKMEAFRSSENCSSDS